MNRLEIPVVFCTFNRYETTIKVFSKIKQAKPKRLYLVSDAARTSKPGEGEQVSRIRRDIESAVDWECDLIKVYADHNMGCAKRISSALDYVFTKEECAIILEDDCYPSDSFFEYCQTLLNRYKDDDRIMGISGNTVIEYSPDNECDYLFTSVFGCWGWATWRRSWGLFDYSMKRFAEITAEDRKKIKKTLITRNAYWTYMANWRALYKSENKFSWAYIFNFYSVVQDKLFIIPAVNLVINFGFDENATHTVSSKDYYVSVNEELKFPLRIPQKIERDLKYDLEFYQTTQKSGLIIRIKEILGLDINRSVFEKLKLIFNG